MPPISYSQTLNKDFLFEYNRRKITKEYMITKIIRKTAKSFNINPKTVVKWVHRYNKYDPAGLIDRKRTPFHIHLKLSKQQEQPIIELRKKTHLSAKRLKIEFALLILHLLLIELLKMPTY